MNLDQFVESELQASGLNVNEIAHAVIVDSEVQKQRDGKSYRLYTAQGIRGRVAKLCGTTHTKPYFDVAFNRAIKTIHSGAIEKVKGNFLLAYNDETDEYVLLKHYESEKSAKAAKSSHSKTYGKENLFIV